MRLTREENEMLEGKYGYPVQKSMEIMVGLGECYDAKRMIPVASTHLLANIKMGKASALLFGEMASKGGKFVTFADNNPIGVDPYLWKELDFPGDIAHEWIELLNTCTRMGLFLSNTCTPYLVGHFPRPGEHIAWSESSAVVFANSVLGARTNREGGPSSLAAALCGRVPEYGLHLDQNRHGNLEISVTTRLRDLYEYAALGYFIGKIAQDRIPVLTGIPPSVSLDELKLLGAGTATSGSVALFHIVGTTPEAPTREIAFGRKRVKDWQKLEFGDKELRDTSESLSAATNKEVDLIIIGCPHASISEIRDITLLLSGKKLKAGVELWILSSRIVKNYADKMGFLKVVEEAGGRILSETCPLLMPDGYLKRRGHKTVATNSAKMAFIISVDTGGDIASYFGSAKRCIEAAISGKWD